MSLREALVDWVEPDVAAHQLAVCLGLFGAEVDFQLKAKPILWSNNPIGDMLYRMLDELVEVAVLERDEEDRVRWNPLFRGGWE